MKPVRPTVTTEDISPALLLRKLEARIARHMEGEAVLWEQVSFVDREALRCLDAVVQGSDGFMLGFWLGFAEGAGVFQRGAYQHELSKHKAKRAGRSGGAIRAKQAEEDWRALARALLQMLVAQNPSWGRDRLTNAVLSSDVFIKRSDPPSEGSIHRLIAAMRRDGKLPPRVTDSEGGH